MVVLTDVIDHCSDLGDKGTDFTGMHLGSFPKVSTSTEYPMDFSSDYSGPKFLILF